MLIGRGPRTEPTGKVAVGGDSFEEVYLTLNESIRPIRGTRRISKTEPTTLQL